MPHRMRIERRRRMGAVSRGRCCGVLDDGEGVDGGGGLA